MSQRPLVIPLPRSMPLHWQGQPPAVPHRETAGPTAVRRHDPYMQVFQRRSLCEVLPNSMYRLLVPPAGSGQRRPNQRRGTTSSNKKEKERAALEQFLHGDTCVAFHSWCAIEENAAYEDEVLGLASPFQPMVALANLRGDSDITKYALHLGQFLDPIAFGKENFLTLRVLADLTGVTFYKCDFDHNKCCRIFLDGAQSLERVLAFSKRIRTTTFGVFVAHTETAALDLELIHFGDRIPNVPYHSMPIELMRTSRESGRPTMALSPQQQHQHPSMPALARGSLSSFVPMWVAPKSSRTHHTGGGGDEATSWVTCGVPTSPASSYGSDTVFKQ